MQGRRADEGTTAQWRKLVPEAARSGESIRSFCRERGVTEGLSPAKTPSAVPSALTDSLA
jgi:hypothetical protein